MLLRHLIPLLWLNALMPVQAQLRIGSIDPALPKETPKRNAAALASARTQGSVFRLKPAAAGGWQADGRRIYAPEEFDVVWYHEGDGPGAALLGEAACEDLRLYVLGGGVLLLSGAAGRILNGTGVETSPFRILPPSDSAFTSGVLVREKYRHHPIFSGLDTGKPVLLTAFGGNALADFYGSSSPTGDLLVEGNAGLGERSLVEYRFGQGRILFVGWRLPDFTTDRDLYRPNLEQLFGNILNYLSRENANRARMVSPPGDNRYTRIYGVPFLRTAGPVDLSIEADAEKTAAFLTDTAGTGESFPVEGAYVEEMPVERKPVSVRALGPTLLSKEKPVSRFAAALQAEQEAVSR